jgi:hypothetical protein
MLSEFDILCLHLAEFFGFMYIFSMHMYIKIFFHLFFLFMILFTWLNISYYNIQELI